MRKMLAAALFISILFTLPDGIVDAQRFVGQPLWGGGPAGGGGGPSACGTESAPVAAVNAGFATCAANYDFTAATGTNWIPAQFAFSGSVSTTANWLDCTGEGSQSNLALPWHNYTNTIPCDITVLNDPGTDQTGTPYTGQTLRYRFLNTYTNTPGPSAFGQGVGMMQGINDATVASNVSQTFPLGVYIEAMMRIDPLTFDSTVNGAITEDNGYFTATVPPSADASAVSYALNEEIYNYTGGAGAGTVGGGNNQISSGILWSWQEVGGTVGAGCNNYAPGGTCLPRPAGYSLLNYHKYGTLVTTNGSSAIFACFFIDDLFQSCNITNAGGVANGGLWQGTAANFAERTYLFSQMLTCAAGGTGGNCGPATSAQVTTHYQYTQWFRVWSCAGWASGQCNGSTLSSSNGLIYYH